jgi:hypothetical protein
MLSWCGWGDDLKGIPVYPCTILMIRKCMGTGGIPETPNRKDIEHYPITILDDAIDDSLICI